MNLQLNLRGALMMSVALCLAPLPVLADPASQQRLSFDVEEGPNLNSFLREGPVAAHLLLRSGQDPRILIAFPAGVLFAALHGAHGTRIRIGNWPAVGMVLCALALLSWDIRVQAGIWAWTGGLEFPLRFPLWISAETFAACLCMAVALYNPASKARPHQLGQAFDLLRAIKSPQTVVLFVRKAATSETSVVITNLAEADPAAADMRTLVIIGAAATRLISRKNHRPWIYTPRAEPEVAR